MMKIRSYKFKDTNMLVRPSIFSVLFLLITSISHSTEVYISIDENGHRVFSDQPSDGSLKHKVKDISIIPSFEIPAKKPGAEVASEMLYQSLNLTAPTSGSSFTRDFLGNYKVNAQLLPSLLPADEAVLIINGQEVESGSSLSWQRLNTDRGEHSIQVLVRDRVSGKEKISSNTIKIYVQR